MIHVMRIKTRFQRSYDHRLRDLVRLSGDMTVATDLGVPRSTARGWLRRAPRRVVSLNVLDSRETELQHEILRLRRRIQKLTSLLQLTLVLLRVSGFTLARERLPDGTDKLKILKALDRARVLRTSDLSVGVQGTF